jgi:WD40 repeat protein
LVIEYTDFAQEEGHPYLSKMEIRARDLLSDTVLFRYSPPNGIYSASVSGDGRYVAVLTLTGVKLFDIENNSEPLVLDMSGPKPNPEERFYRAEWSPDGKRMVSLSEHKIWDTQSGTLIQSERNDEFYEVQWSPDSRYFTGARLYEPPRSGQATPVPYDVIDAATGKVLFALDNTEEPTPKRVAWSPDSKQIATITDNKVVSVYEVPSGKVLWSLPGKAIAWTVDGKALAVLTDNQTVSLYDAGSGSASSVLNGNFELVNQMTFSPDGRYLVIAGVAPTITLLDVATGKSAFTLVGHIGAIQWVRWSADGQRLISMGKDATIRVWDLANPSGTNAVPIATLPVGVVAPTVVPNN